MSDFKLLPVSKRVYEKENPIFLPVSEWEFTYHSKYWIVTKLFKEGGLDLFKEMAECYPIVDRNNDGVLDGVGPRVQFKEILGIGLSYKF